MSFQEAIYQLRDLGLGKPRYRRNNGLPVPLSYRPILPIEKPPRLVTERSALEKSNDLINLDSIRQGRQDRRTGVFIDARNENLP